MGKIQKVLKVVTVTASDDERDAVQLEGDGITTTLYVARGTATLRDNYRVTIEGARLSDDKTQ